MRSSKVILNDRSEQEELAEPVHDGENTRPGAPVAVRSASNQNREPERSRARARTISLVARMVAGLLILAVALLIAAGLLSNRRQALQAPIEDRARRVRAVEAVPQPAASVSRTWEGFGTARARVQADVAAEVSGRVVNRPEQIDPGVAVASGEVLVRIDESDYRERLQGAQSAVAALSAQIEGLDIEESRLRDQLVQAQEQLRLAQLELDRLEQARLSSAGTEQELFRLQGAVARQEGERLRLQQQLDAMPTRRAAMRAELAGRQNEASVAERQLARTVVTSPISGVLQSINANVGEMIQSGQRIARVVDLQRIEIPLRLPASAQGEIRIGDMATVHAGGSGVGNGQGRSWQARVARVAPEADAQTRTITVFLEVDQRTPGTGGTDRQNGGSSWSELLMPGRFVSAELAARAGDREMLIVTPRRAVSDDLLWVAVQDERGRTVAQPRQVRVLFTIDARLPHLDEDETQWAVIGAGLQAGEQVIVTNLDELLPGIRVEVVGRGAD